MKLPKHCYLYPGRGNSSAVLVRLEISKDCIVEEKFKFVSFSKPEFAIKQAEIFIENTIRKHFGRKVNNLPVNPPAYCDPKSQSGNSKKPKSQYKEPIVSDKVPLSTFRKGFFHVGSKKAAYSLDGEESSHNWYELEFYIDGNKYIRTFLYNQIKGIKVTRSKAYSEARVLFELLVEAFGYEVFSKAGVSSDIKEHISFDVNEDVLTGKKKVKGVRVILYNGTYGDVTTSFSVQSRVGVRNKTKTFRSRTERLNHRKEAFIDAYVHRLKMALRQYIDI